MFFSLDDIEYYSFKKNAKIGQNRAFFRVKEKEFPKKAKKAPKRAKKATESYRRHGTSYIRRNS